MNKLPAECLCSAFNHYNPPLTQVEYIDDHGVSHVYTVTSPAIPNWNDDGSFTPMIELSNIGQFPLQKVVSISTPVIVPAPTDAIHMQKMQFYKCAAFNKAFPVERDIIFINRNGYGIKDTIAVKAEAMLSTQDVQVWLRNNGQCSIGNIFPLPSDPELQPLIRLERRHAFNMAHPVGSEVVLVDADGIEKIDIVAAMATLYLPSTRPVRVRLQENGEHSIDNVFSLPATCTDNDKEKARCDAFNMLFEEDETIKYRSYKETKEAKVVFPGAVIIGYDDHVSVVIVEGGHVFLDAVIMPEQQTPTPSNKGTIKSKNQERCDEFNLLFPAGTVVEYKAHGLGDDENKITREAKVVSPGTEMHHGPSKHVAMVNLYDGDCVFHVLLDNVIMSGQPKQQNKIDPEKQAKCDEFNKAFPFGAEIEYIYGTGFETRKTKVVRPGAVISESLGFAIVYTGDRFINLDQVVTFDFKDEPEQQTPPPSSTSEDIIDQYLCNNPICTEFNRIFPEWTRIKYKSSHTIRWVDTCYREDYIIREAKVASPGAVMIDHVPAVILDNERHVPLGSIITPEQPPKPALRKLGVIGKVTKMLANQDTMLAMLVSQEKMLTAILTAMSEQAKPRTYPENQFRIYGIDRCSWLDRYYENIESLDIAVNDIKDNVDSPNTVTGFCTETEAYLFVDTPGRSKIPFVDYAKGIAKPPYDPDSKYKIYGTGEAAWFFRSYTGLAALTEEAYNIWGSPQLYCDIEIESHFFYRDFVKYIRVKTPWDDCTLKEHIVKKPEMGAQNA